MVVLAFVRHVDVMYLPPFTCLEGMLHCGSTPDISSLSLLQLPKFDMPNLQVLVSLYGHRNVAQYIYDDQTTQWSLKAALLA